MDLVDSTRLFAVHTLKTQVIAHRQRRPRRRCHGDIYIYIYESARRLSARAHVHIKPIEDGTVLLCGAKAKVTARNGVYTDRCRCRRCRRLRLWEEFISNAHAARQPNIEYRAGLRLRFVLQRWWLANSSSSSEDNDDDDDVMSRHHE